MRIVSLPNYTQPDFMTEYFYQKTWNWYFYNLQYLQEHRIITLIIYFYQFYIKRHFDLQFTILSYANHVGMLTMKLQQQFTEIKIKLR